MSKQPGRRPWGRVGAARWTPVLRYMEGMGGGMMDHLPWFIGGVRRWVIWGPEKQKANKSGRQSLIANLFLSVP